jgi:hypothetical protein
VIAQAQYNLAIASARIPTDILEHNMHVTKNGYKMQ